MKDSDNKNYYELLRVERDASFEEIKQAYKDIVIVYHPDSNFFSEIVPDSGSTPEEVELFKKITNAYQTLINKEKRKEYDKKLNKEELNKGVQKTGEWIRPDGSSARERSSKRSRQPTITDLQKLQKNYRERINKQQEEEEKAASVAEILEESHHKKNFGMIILLWMFGMIIVLGFIALILLF